ncbi:sorting nexin-30 isoform X2 [Lingula anatina]|uniref:Sorting nexin-30 isoform X2 n=1 Tax=Lingula anatina TaxID=7574 RepID=A0A1S3JSE4_LINAN|nr:sorting nexin-30 isoform X2 [Lingula anatina]|eukprot:XP_013413026.1 sorting nexin-30 isoform X2 [Lingula anatina]
MADPLSAAAAERELFGDEDFEDLSPSSDQLNSINLGSDDGIPLDSENSTTADLLEGSGIRNLELEDEQMDNETKDLFIVVDNPEKHVTTMESYITFKITTKTTRCDFDNHEYSVRRRYNDFLWLRQRLEETQPSHLIPPLPEKHSLRRLDRFSPEFLKNREKALQKFMSRLEDHPVLSFNEHLKVFLTAKQFEFQAYKKQGSGFISRTADSLRNLSASYMMKNRSPEFTMLQEYIQTFGEKLGTMDRIQQRLVKEQMEYVTELNEIGPVFTLWSNSEDELSTALTAVAHSIETCCNAVQESISETEGEFGQSLKEYILYVEAVKAVLRRRDAMQMEYELAAEELQKKKDEKEAVKISDPSFSFGSLLGKDPSEVKQGKREKLEQQIEELAKEVERLNDRTVCADSDLKADMERWHKFKRKDFRDLFIKMADKQISFYEKSLKAWEDAIPLIQNTEQETKKEED